MIEIKCAGCGKIFQADENVSRAFCIYCGYSNEVPVRQEEPASADEQQYAQWKQRIEEVRFKVWNKNTGEKGDTFIGFWTMLMFHGRNSRGFFGVKRAYREANKFWKQPKIANVLEEAGDRASQLISEQLYDSARVFYVTCREDRHFGSKMLGMGKLKPEQIADKVAGQVCDLILSYWLHVDPINYRDEIFRAAWFAYAPLFPEKSNALAIRVKQLPQEEQDKLSEIIGVPI